MSDMQATIRHNQVAVAEFLEALNAVPAADWDRPRAPGKWSPAQVADHVAIVYELGRKLMEGTAKDPSAPRWLRPLIGLMLRATILRTGRFPKSTTAKAFLPADRPPPRDVLSGRIETASRAFEQLATQHARAGRTTFDHPAFGRFRVSDYVQFQAYHTKHHEGQLPRPSSRS
jgi:uncharacterized damage-inducible protein DinB